MLVKGYWLKWGWNETFHIDLRLIYIFVMWSSIGFFSQHFPYVNFARGSSGSLAAFFVTYRVL